MNVNRSKLSKQQIHEMYQKGIPLAEIQSAAGITRTAIYDALKSIGVFTNRKSVTELTCEHCGKVFQLPTSRSHANRKFCSKDCRKGGARCL